MGVIKSVILDEYDRNRRMQQVYEQERAKLPHGAITRKKIKGHEYYYWMYRENGIVVNKYISSKDHDIDSLLKKVEKRKQLDQLIRKLKKEQLEMERYLKVTSDG